MMQTDDILLNMSDICNQPYFTHWDAYTEFDTNPEKQQ